MIPLLLALIVTRGLHADYAPHPTHAGRAVLHYEIGQGTGGWWLWRCTEGPCTLVRRGAGQDTGAIEEFAPAGVFYSLRGYVGGVYTVEDTQPVVGSWVFLVGVGKE